MADFFDGPPTAVHPGIDENRQCREHGQKDDGIQNAAYGTSGSHKILGADHRDVFLEHFHFENVYETFLPKDR